MISCTFAVALLSPACFGLCWLSWVEGHGIVNCSLGWYKYVSKQQGLMADLGALWTEQSYAGMVHV